MNLIFCWPRVVAATQAKPEEVAALVMIVFVILAALVGLAVFAFWIWMIIDCVLHEKENKAVWLLIVIFANWLGALIYFAVRRSARKKALRAAASEG